jgi:hypothetical protein
MRHQKVWPKDEAYCDHDTFEEGVCTDCGFECEHRDVSQGFCEDCGKQICDGSLEDYLYEMERDRRAGV